MDRARWQAVPLSWRRPVAVLVGGCVGTALRIGVGEVVGSGSGWPWATLVANLTGALLLGYVLTRLAQTAATSVVSVPLLCTGVLGSYTTFSALSMETWQLWADGHPDVAAAYVALSLFGGLLLAATGIRLAEVRP